MNRPRQNDYRKLYGVEDYGIDWKSFAQDIDKYCNKQEEKIDELERAFRRACANLNGVDGWTYAQWKEWCLKDE